MTEKNGKKTEYKRDKRGRFVKGTAPGPGRPQGMRDFKVDFEEAAREVAKALKLGENPDEVYSAIMKQGIKTLLKGNFNSFWKEFVERIYGKLPDKLEADVNVKEKIAEIELIIKKSLSDENEV
jgi:hypothetical protein